MCYTEEIKNKIKQIGDHFADMSMGEGSMGVKTKAAGIALRAYKEILEDDRQESLQVEFLKNFVSTVVGMRLRSELYSDYQLYCAQQGCEALPRNGFYRKLEKEFNFSSVRKSEGRFMEPTKVVKLLEG